MVWLMLFGCTPSIEEPPPTGAGALQVDRQVVDFGIVDLVSGPDEVLETLILTNTGDGDVHLGDLALAGGAPFSIGPLTSVLIPAGTTASLDLGFAPATPDDFSDTLTLVTDDGPAVQVELVGTGAASQVEASPDTWDFGTVAVGCRVDVELALTNLGNRDASIEGFDYETASGALTLLPWPDGADPDATPLPWVLAPGETASVYVEYFPLSEQADQALLLLETDGLSDGQAVAQQSSQGASSGQVTDVFELAPEGLADLLFAIDTSCGMDDDEPALHGGFDTFLSDLAAVDSDYHVAAVVADDGCVLGEVPYLDNSMTSAARADAFNEMICTTSGTSGCAHTGFMAERAFMMLEAALGPTNVGTGGCNEAFYRDDATLHLIAISDEPEQSPHAYSHYVALFQSMKSDSDDVVIHAVGGDYPHGCDDATAYIGAYEASVATGGLFLSICTASFGDYLGALAGGSADERRTFELTAPAVPETLQVSIDGVPAESGWVYFETLGDVVFEVGA